MKLNSETRDNKLFNNLKSIPSNKITENYGLSKGFYEIFWSTLKDLLLKSFNQTKTSLTMLNKTTLQ